MKHGLVMEGGAMRGLFTAGVIDVMMEQNIVFDGAVGVSAGAVFGCNYKSHQIGRVLRYNLAFCQDPRYCSMRSRIKTGDLFGADFCYRQIPDELDVFDREAYANSPMDFYVVGTDVRSGRAVYHNCLTGDHEDLDWLRASASMPFVSQPVKIGGKLYLDGGVADSIPFKAAEKLGFDRVVVILTRDKSYVKKPMNPKPIDLWYKHYPALAEQLKNRHNVYNNALRELLNWEQQGKAWVLHPSQPIEIGRLERRSDRLQAVYDLGTGDAEASLGSLRTYLAKS